MHIEGLHCAACAWLIQTSVGGMTGVDDVQVNPSAGRAQLQFDPRQQRLSALLERITALGFAPRPLSFTADGADWSFERREALKRLAVAGFGMMAVMTYAASLYAGAMDGMELSMAKLLRLSSLVVATPVVLYAAQPFFVGAWRSLRGGSFGMDVPVALSVGAAYLWSLVAVLRGAGAVYFDSAVMFTFFLLLGRFVEMSLRHRSGQHHDALAGLLPQSAHRIDAGGMQDVLPDELCAGECVRVLPGERIPADGRVISGSTEVDESLLTGESAPRLRAAHSRVIAGTVNVGSAIDVRVTHVGQDSTLASVSRLLERAAADRPQIAQTADRIAGWFVAGILVLALLVGWYWWRVSPAHAFPAMLAVLVVTCPCALSLATPAALAAAATRLARSGLLVTRSRAIERLARADRVVFDKTGTLTRGQPVIETMELLRAGIDPLRCRAIAAAMERYSEHPIARAFAGIEPVRDLAAVSNVAGQGLCATLDGESYRIGQPAFVLQGVRSRGDGMLTQGNVPRSAAQTTLWLGDSRGPLAAFVLTDALRTGAARAIAELRAAGLQPLIASGDQPAVALAVAESLGGLEARGHLRAADKLAWVRQLQADGHTVAMVGDGVNDAPVLAGADVSITVGSGTELAKVSADLILLGDSMLPLAAAVRTSRRTLTIIRQNLLWAVLYNIPPCHWLPVACCSRGWRPWVCLPVRWSWC